MSEDAKSAVMRQIRQKIKQTQAAKYRHANPSPHYTHVYDFFKKIEEIYKVASNSGEFQYLLAIEGAKLIAKLETIDPSVTIRMEWNETEDWTKLRLQGVTVKWSEQMVLKNPGMSKEEYIDVAEMLLA